MQNNNREKGLSLLKKLHGGHTGEEIFSTFEAVCPKMAELTVDLVFGDILQRPNLDIKTRELCIIASLVTLGSALPQVKAHVEAALVCGATKEEVTEVILQTAYFAGFPAAANAMIAIKELFTG